MDTFQWITTLLAAAAVFLAAVSLILQAVLVKRDKEIHSLKDQKKVTNRNRAKIHHTNI